MILKQDAKRLLIYFFYDKDGIIDRYIPYILADMKKNVSKILFVSNGQIASDSINKLSGLADEIIERDNEGYDVWAYKEALEHIGWEKLSKDYDEVVLMNYTIMGPIYPFKEMFDKMDKLDLDFWGMNLYHKVDFDPFNKIDCGFIPEHYQSHFHVYRKSLLESPELKEYWDNMPEINSYEDSIAFHETKFTRHFRKLGFKNKPYVDTTDLKELNPNLILFAPTELIRDKRCPVFKRRSFMHNYDHFLNESVGEATVELMQYLRTNTDYDTNMIWENILRCYDMQTIKDCLHLNYIIPKEETMRSLDHKAYENKKIALVFHAYFPDLAQSTYRYINSMPKEADIYITTNTPEKKAVFEELFKNHKFNKLQVILIENRGRDVSALLVATKSFIMDYDYVCFAHDKKVKQLDPKTIGSGFAYQCLECTLGSEGIVKNTIQLFEDNPRLGLLTPPPPCHGDYFLTLGCKWGPNYDVTKVVYDKLDLRVPISKEVAPIAPLGTMFWFRPEGMKKLFDVDWEYSDFPLEPNKIDGTLLHGIERIYGLVEQDSGYYTAYGYTDYFASIFATNHNYMLSRMAESLYENDIVGAFVPSFHKMSNCIKASSNLKELGKSIVKLYPEYIPGASKKIAKLYYCVDDFNEKDTVIDTKIIDGIETYIFDIPADTKEISSIRFDPGEEGNIIVFSFEMKVVTADDKTFKYCFNDCTVNGLKGNGSVYFPSTDPVLIVDLKKPMKIKTVQITAGINSKLSINDSLDFLNEFRRFSGQRSPIRRLINLLKKTKHNLFI